VIIIAIWVLVSWVIGIPAVAYFGWWLHTWSDRAKENAT
jgi:ABC-type dipeptide/oligopeptide/nickel transport system permease component